MATFSVVAVVIIALLIWKRAEVPWGFLALGVFLAFLAMGTPVGEYLNQAVAWTATNTEDLIAWIGNRILH